MPLFLMTPQAMSCVNGNMCKLTNQILSKVNLLIQLKCPPLIKVEGNSAVCIILGVTICFREEEK